MTDKEAIEVLKQEIEFYKRITEKRPVLKDDKDLTTLFKANILAIKALEQGSCEDAISRKDILNILPAFRFNSINDYLDAKNKIEKLPPVTPQPKTAHWETRNIFPNWLYCSECDEPYGWNDTPRYCPSCGAKMGGKKE